MALRQSFALKEEEGTSDKYDFVEQISQNMSIW